MIELGYHCLQTIVWPSKMCVWGHCPAESTAHPPSSPTFQSFPPPHDPKSDNTGQHPSFPISIPTPFQPIHPHTMRLFPPPCFTVGDVVRSEMDFPLCFHTYTFPSDPILFILVSSVHKTLFQSATVQFPCHCANSSRL